MGKHIIVVGAGIGGVSDGIHGGHGGSDVALIEQYSIPGGLCTSWKRREYLYDDSTSWWSDSRPGTEGYRM